MRTRVRRCAASEATPRVAMAAASPRGARSGLAAGVAGATGAGPQGRGLCPRPGLAADRGGSGGAGPVRVGEPAGGFLDVPRGGRSSLATEMPVGPGARTASAEAEKAGLPARAGGSVSPGTRLRAGRTRGRRGRGGVSAQGMPGAEAEAARVASSLREELGMLRSGPPPPRPPLREPAGFVPRARALVPRASRGLCAGGGGQVGGPARGVGGGRRGIPAGAGGRGSGPPRARGAARGRARVRAEVSSPAPAPRLAGRGVGGDVTAQPRPPAPSPSPRRPRARPSPRATNQLAAGARAPLAANQRGGRGAGRAGPGARSPSRGAAVTAPSEPRSRRRRSSALGDPRPGQCPCGAAASDAGEGRVAAAPAPRVAAGGLSGAPCLAAAPTRSFPGSGGRARARGEGGAGPGRRGRGARGLRREAGGVRTAGTALRRPPASPCAGSGRAVGGRARVYAASAGSRCGPRRRGDPASPWRLRLAGPPEGGGGLEAGPGLRCGCEAAARGRARGRRDGAHSPARHRSSRPPAGSAGRGAPAAAILQPQASDSVWGARGVQALLSPSLPRSPRPLRSPSGGLCGHAPTPGQLPPCFRNALGPVHVGEAHGAVEALLPDSDRSPGWGVRASIGRQAWLPVWELGARGPVPLGSMRGASARTEALTPARLWRGSFRCSPGGVGSHRSTSGKAAVRGRGARGAGLALGLGSARRRPPSPPSVHGLVLVLPAHAPGSATWELRQAPAVPEGWAHPCLRCPALAGPQPVFPEWPGPARGSVVLATGHVLAAHGPGARPLTLCPCGGRGPGTAPAEGRQDRPPAQGLPGSSAGAPRARRPPCLCPPPRLASRLAIGPRQALPGGGSLGGTCGLRLRPRRTTSHFPVSPSFSPSSVEGGWPSCRSPARGVAEQRAPASDPCAPCHRQAWLPPLPGHSSL
ncbi:collagen alpha-2(I) chain-like isoform X5 [Canis lupus familiaris]|uniref:collagen alpha-2(I) chain-like isoform X5 n=1 Tax=Canis lupus familiaris TaxID=9615 RepID=UPI0018F4125D|nr:collagen alpha-2(I) chain-like isoform X5 [Canis lupus familiaris]